MSYARICLLALVVLFAAGCAGPGKDHVCEAGGGYQPGAASWTPLQVSLWNPVQVFPDTWSVYGISLDLLYGRNVDLWGLGLGTSHAYFHATGVDLTLVSSYVYCETNGLQASLFSTNAVRMNGVQLSLGNNRIVGDSSGLQLAGVMNAAGAPACPVNMTGVQISLLVNVADHFDGVQISLLGNERQSGSGISIGLMNAIYDAPIPFLPIINFGVGDDPEADYE